MTLGGPKRFLLKNCDKKNHIFSSLLTIGERLDNEQKRPFSVASEADPLTLSVLYRIKELICCLGTIRWVPFLDELFQLFQACPRELPDMDFHNWTGRQEGHAQEDDGEHPRKTDGLHQPRRQAGGPPLLQTLRVRLQVDGGLLRRKFTSK